MGNIIRARVTPGRDDDLIAWLEAQPTGQRSEAIRMLMRDGLRMRQIDTQLPRLVRQAIGEALSNVQFRPTQPGVFPGEENGIEEQYGGQLDDLLRGFG